MFIRTHGFSVNTLRKVFTFVSFGMGGKRVDSQCGFLNKRLVKGKTER